MSIMQWFSTFFHPRTPYVQFLGIVDPLPLTVIPLKIIRGPQVENHCSKAYVRIQSLSLVSIEHDSRDCKTKVTKVNNGYRSCMGLNGIFSRHMAEIKSNSTGQATSSQTQKPDIACFRNAFDSLLTQVFLIINNCNRETKESEIGSQNEMISNFSRQLNKCHDMVEQIEGLDVTPRELEESISQVKQQIEQRMEVVKQCREEGLFTPQDK